jgi:repressor LexA
MNLTPRQQQVVDFLRDYAAREGMPPTQAEIARRFGFTQKAACDHLKLIAAKGVIEVRRDIPRGIHFPGRGPATAAGTLPLLLRLAEGRPSLQPDQVDEWVPIAPALFRPRADYLRQAAAAVAELGIQAGDLIGVQLAVVRGGRRMMVAKRFAAAGIELVIGRDLREPAAGEARLEIEGLYCGHFHPHSG